MTNSSNRDSFVLYPSRNMGDKDIKPYKDKLDNALSDPYVTNIAVTGPYDTGKSTLLLSYFKQREKTKHPCINIYNSVVSKINSLKNKCLFGSNAIPLKKDYEFINLPNFFKEMNTQQTGDLENESDSNQKESPKEIENTIEKGIVKQLLYSEKPSKFSYSRINRLRYYHKIEILMIDLLIILAFCLPPLNHSIKSFEGNMWSYILYIVFLVIVSFGIAHISSKLKLSAKIKAPVGDSEITTDYDNNNENTDLFSYFGDELQYYFRKSGVRIVIFEDIDRFKQPIIFQKLYELNKNLNKCGTKIVFIYTLRESVFSTTSDSNYYENKSAEQKSKFFDYILPIFPIHSLENSRKQWRNKFYCCECFKKDPNYRPDSKFINGLGLLIFDNREIISIVSEYDIYTKKLPQELFENKNNSAPNKLLAAIIYKNVYPRDFENISIGNSKLDYVLRHKDELDDFIFNYLNNSNQIKINNLKEHIQKANSIINTQIEKILKGKYTSIFNHYNWFNYNKKRYDDRDDFSKQLEFWKDYLNSDGKDEDNYEEITEIIKLTPEEEEVFNNYIEKKSQKNEYTQKLNKLFEESEKLKTEISRLSLKEVLDQYILINTKLQKELTENFIGFNFILKNNILRYLLLSGYLDNSFYDYISPDSYNSIDLVDRDLIYNVQSRVYLSKSKQVNHPEKVVEEIKDFDGKWYFAYSVDILKVLCIKEMLNESKQLIEHVRDQKDYKFLVSVMEDSKLSDLAKITLLKAIFNKWKTFFLELSNNSRISGRDKYIIINYLNDCFKLNDLICQDVFEYLKKNKAFEKSIYKKYLNSKDKSIKNLLNEDRIYKFESLRVFFKDNLEYLIKNNFYEGNFTNFTIILTYFGDFKNLLKNQKTYNINSTFIDDNISNYISETKRNVTLDNLIKYVEYAKVNDLENAYKIAIIKYSKIKLPESTTDIQKLNFLQSIDFEKQIAESDNTSIDLLSSLIEDKKIPYKYNFWKALNDRDTKVAEQYFLVNESKQLISDIFTQQNQWRLILRYLSITKFSKYLVNLIERNNYEWSIDDCDKQSQEKLIKYGTNVRTFQKLINSSVLSGDNKNKILEKILTNFKGEFTKEEISEFYFDDANFINSWIINGRTKIDLSDLSSDMKEKVRDWSETLKPFGVISKNNSLIMRKKLNSYFK